MSEAPLYAVWKELRYRCENPKNKQYVDYGGRGIKVCERWSVFDNFLADMGAGYAPGLEIDRVDNDGDYCKENCRWTNDVRQARNKRRTIRVQWKGETVVLADLAERFGLTYGELYQRHIRYGWPIERALTPVKHRRHP